MSIWLPSRGIIFVIKLSTYVFKYLNTGEITPEEFFTDPYAKEVYESEYVHTDKKNDV